MARIHYYSHRGRHRHPTTFFHRLVTGLGLPLIVVAAACLIATGTVLVPHYYLSSLGTIFAALGASLLRLLIAYALSLGIGVPLALLAEGNRRVENVLLPVYDVLESIPIIAFFPVIILFFVHSGFLEGAAVFMLLFSMVWSIVFNAIGGLKMIPKDVRAAGKVFGLSRFHQFLHIELPALFPPLVTGSILALAAGWNIVIVAEALHAYAPQSANAHDLFGIGSLLVSAASAGNSALLISAMTVLVAAIAFINIFVWQTLLARAEQYKFE